MDKQTTLIPVMTAWAVITNSDLTEGRGIEAVTAICESEATARRLGAKRYIQGSDCPIEKVDLYRINGMLYGPVTPVAASKDDLTQQKVLDVIQALKKIGVTDEEIALLRKP